MNTATDSTGILVVEDDPSIAAVLEEILTGKDYSVRVATNPSEAIAAVEFQIPELVLMDVNLSSDIDGIETVRRLRVEHEDLPVCFITAFSDDETVNRAEEVGPMAYLVKPFEMADVLTMVNISLASARRMKARLTKVMAQAGKSPAEAAALEAPASPVQPDVLVDKLTGLPNRLAIERDLAEWTPDTRNLLAVLIVEHVALLLQRFGGAAVDQVLFAYSQHLSQHLPDHCRLGRWDVNAFVVSCHDGGPEIQREVAHGVAAPMLYHLRLPGRSALLRVMASMKVIDVTSAAPTAERVAAVITSHR